MNDNKHKIEFIPMPAEPKSTEDELKVVTDIKALVDKVIHESFLLGYNNAKRAGSYWERGEHIPIQSKKQLLAGLESLNQQTQTFGDIQWDMGMQDRSELVVVCQNCNNSYRCYHNRKSVERSGICYICTNANTGKMRLIGIHGPARAGKDTLASYLLSNLSDDWTRASFADPIKAMLSAIGVDCSDEAKAVVDEWGRHTIDSNMWVKAFARLNAGKCVIVPDVRFENEAESVREHGVLIHLTGRGGIDGNHVSENPIGFKEGDIVIDNSRDLDWLHAQVDANAVLDGFISEVGE